MEYDELKLKKGKSTAPELLNEADLINLMDKNGVGTDSTIHEHIKTILTREYANKVKGKFQPT